MSAINDVDTIARQLERRRQKSDVCYVAKEALEKMKRERHLIDSSSRQKRPRRPASLPSNFLKHTEVQRKKHQASKDHNAKWRARTIPSGTNSSKDCQRNGGQMHASSKSPKTMLDVGKSYTNRCVKEILKKLEHGSYSSRWYDFSSPNMPLPKWINFNWTESGGVLDAFLCKGNEDNHVCYLMDVRIGEKVGRLLKYPGPIRVGQNGYTSKAKCHKDSLYDFELEGLTLNDITSKKMKSRPFPLSWNEQFDWKDAKVLTVGSKYDNAVKNQVQETVDREACKNARKEPQDFRSDYVSMHSYVLEPVNMDVVQSLPFTRRRQKCIREFYIANKSIETQKAKVADETEDNDSIKRGAHSRENVDWCSKSGEDINSVDAHKCKEFLSINVKPMVSFSDVEVKRSCEHQRNFGRKKLCQSELETTENADRAKDRILPTAIRKEKRIYGKNVDATVMQCGTVIVKENPPDFDFRHLSSVISDASSSPVLPNSIDFDEQETRKRTVVFSRTNDNSQTGWKDSQMPRIIPGNGEMEVQNYSPTNGCVNEKLHHSSYNGGNTVQKKTFSQLDKKGTSSRRTISGRELEKVRHEIRDSINSEISCLEKELNALLLKVP